MPARKSASRSTAFTLGVISNLHLQLVSGKVVNAGAVAGKQGHAKASARTNTMQPLSHMAAILRNAVTSDVIRVVEAALGGSHVGQLAMINIVRGIKI